MWAYIFYVFHVSHVDYTLRSTTMFCISDLFDLLPTPTSELPNISSAFMYCAIYAIRLYYAMCHRLSVTYILCMKHIAKALPSSKRKPENENFSPDVRYVQKLLLDSTIGTCARNIDVVVSCCFRRYPYGDEENSRSSCRLILESERKARPHNTHPMHNTRT